jgi:hypothetical protein
MRPPPRFHDLRPKQATTLLPQANVHPDMVKQRLGHSNILVTLNTYRQVLPNIQEVAAVAIGRVVDGSARPLFGFSVAPLHFPMLAVRRPVEHGVHIFRPLLVVGWDRIAGGFVGVTLREFVTDDPVGVRSLDVELALPEMFVQLPEDDAHPLPRQNGQGTASSACGTCSRGLDEQVNPVPV